MGAGNNFFFRISTIFQSFYWLDSHFVILSWQCPIRKRRVTVSSTNGHHNVALCSLAMKKRSHGCYKCILIDKFNFSGRIQKKVKKHKYYTWGMLVTENIAQMISYEVRFQVFYTRKWVVYRFYPVCSVWIHTTEKKSGPWSVSIKSGVEWLVPTCYYNSFPCVAFSA